MRFILFASCLLLLVSFTPVFATEDIGYSQIAPDSPIYFLKTIREGIEQKFAFTPRVKLIRQLEFATRRLREVKSLVLNNRQDLIEQNLESYWHHLKNLPEQELEDRDFAKRITEVLGVHLETLETVYADLSHPRAKMALRALINRISQRADLGNSKMLACDFLAREASTSAGIEREVLTQRAEDCLYPK